MIIGIDGNEANIKERVGVNTYAFEILWGLYKLQDEVPNPKHRFIIYLKNEPLGDLPKASSFWEYKVLGPRKFWGATRLTPHLYTTKLKTDIFFTPSHYLPPFCPVPAACSIMDIGFLEFSEQFNPKDYWQLRLWTARSVRVAKKIFSISETTKKEIVRHYSFARTKVVVTPLGYVKGRFNLQRNKNDVRRLQIKLNLPKNYILFLGTLKPSKNLEGLIEAWALIEQKFPETQLVIAGKKGWLFNRIFQTVKSLNIEKRVVFTGFIPEADKESLIKGAKAFVLPSLWEGFGLDVVSAMASGIPVIVSDRGSLPEVVGTAGIIIDPTNYQEIGSAIEKVLTMNKTSYNIVAGNGVAQAKKFSWSKAAKITLKSFEKM